ncbi:MAG: hypothetical protein WDN04_12040 [Rhodospirillales bacterium]
MPEYRRNRVAGGTYFFTVNLADRRSDLLVREVARLRSAVGRTRARHPFEIDAWAVLPDHTHAVWTLPAGDADFSARWASIKRLFSASMHSGGTRHMTISATAPSLNTTHRRTTNTACMMAYAAISKSMASSAIVRDFRAPRAPT